MGGEIPLKVMVVACADSPLLRDRALVPLAGGAQVVWFTESAFKPQADCRIIHSPRGGRFAPLKRLLSWARFLVAYRRERPDVLHVHWACFPPIFLFRQWKNLIVSPMGSDILLPGRFGYRRRMVRGILRRAKLVTSKSEYMDQSLRDLNVGKERLVRMTWGIEDEYFTLYEKREQSRRKLGLDPDEMVFFSPRAMKPLYRVDEIVKAFVRFLREGGEGVLLVSEMYGNDLTRKSLEEIAGEFKASGNIRFLGALDGAAMKECYAAADAVISYALSDGMPQTLYEAMAAGCFPIFTDLPQYCSLLSPRRNSYLCATGKSESLEEGMRYAFRAIRSQWNPADNRETIRRLASREVEVARMCSIYQECR